jgi:hypothetical protein
LIVERAGPVVFVVHNKRRPSPTSIKAANGLTVAIAVLALCQSAYAHGIAGNRFFVGTLTFDDPAVADEAILPDFSMLNHPIEGGIAVDNRIDWSFARLLTPTLQAEIESGWVQRNWSNAHASGFETTDVGIKGEMFRNNEHEALISAQLLWGIGRSGAQGVGENDPNTIQPGIFFGKGFGDLPEWLAWLRSFAVTGAIVDELPIGTTSTALGPNLTTVKLGPILMPSVETLHWGFSIQYSTYYLTSRFTGGSPKEEPLNQFLPLAEFSFDSPRGQNTAATVNPGFAYVAVTWQVAAEAIVPLNREGGSGIGFRAQLLLFLDDLLPSLFAKPLLTDQPDRSQIAWH